MAIMGASGAGKSSLLDILAKKPKSGLVEGDILVNHQRIPNDEFKSLIGYVDQEDTMLSTLTVYETVLCSAMLRLPREMSVQAKKLRTLETLDELGILHIKDAFIGKSGHRSISGGEKRRVSIACELVTSPKILFLDEPTSGLDSFNAFNVIDSLARLARDHQRTIVFTIHQPQSNIVALFDQLILLGRGGRLVYSGALAQCHDYFQKIGHPCPAGYNLADFLIDLTMKHSSPSNGDNAALGRQSDSSGSSSPRTRSNLSTVNAANSSHNVTGAHGEETELTTRKTYTDLGGSLRLRNSAGQLRQSGFIRQSLSSWYSSHQTEEDPREEDTKLLIELEGAFANSELAKQFEISYEQLDDANISQTRSNLNATHRRASFWQQFMILSGRAFKNLYRNPMLMLSHYMLAIILASQSLHQSLHL